MIERTKQLNLIEFAKTLPETFKEQQFIDHLMSVVDLKEIQKLTSHERQAIHDAAQYLADYMLLIHECEGELQMHEGAPVVEYRGPFIANVLTRPAGDKPDREQLETLGVGGADKYFGS